MPHEEGRTSVSADNAGRSANVPTGSIAEPMQHSYAAPPFEEAKVFDAMRMGVFSCPPDMQLRDVARMMSTYRIHCVVVSELGDRGERPWGMVSDADLVRAAGDVERRTAGSVASTELVTVAADEPLARSARLMSEHGVSHLVVVQPQTGHPVGVLSTLDVAGVLAWGS